MGNIYVTPQLTKQDLLILQEVESIMAKLRYALSSPRRWFGVLRRSTFARAIQGSNSIEGYHVTREDAIAAIEGEEPFEAETETWAAVNGYRRAMTYVLQTAEDPYFEYSQSFIRALHFMLLDYDLSKRPGSWRPGSIYVRDEKKGIDVYAGPDIDLVPDLINALVDDLRQLSDRPSMVKAAMAHLNLVMIHPFSDGNGRMARILQTSVLSRQGIIDPRFCSIEEYLGRNTQGYYDVLAAVGQGQWNPGNNALPWVRFCLIAHFNQATTLLRRTRETERVWNELERLIADMGLPDRVIYALSDAAFGYRIRNATYRTVADIKEVTASRDLKLLVDNRLLVPTGEKRGRIYVASPSLLELRNRNREPRSTYKSPIPDDLYLSGI
ncbi:MAG: Fic family protein [Acidobacteriota bacterium]|nr:Fic family protein [Acidobacteriota bacterium]